MLVVDILFDFLRESFFFLLFLLFFLFVSLGYFVVFNKTIRFRLLSAFSYALLQIYVSNLALSFLSIKRAFPFILINLIVPLIILYKKRKELNLKKIFCFSKFPLHLKVVLAFVSILFIYLWVIAFFFPPLGTDDIDYRLPVVFENVRSGTLFRPNERCDPRMAFPQIPYSVFEAYILVSGSDKFIDLSNIVFLIISVLAVYSISRTLGSTNELSLIVSMFVPVTPVFIGQMKSNYVDLAFASFLLASLAFQLELLKNQRSDEDYQIPMAVYMGLLLGTKYTALIFLPDFGKPYCHVYIFTKLSHKPY